LQGGDSLNILYNRMTSETTQGATMASAAAEGAATFQSTLAGQKLATSGVNVDEEAVQMLGYQRSFQAAARFIATLNELFGILVNL
jgi:flagellar hook-associated protein 1